MSLPVDKYYIGQNSKVIMDQDNQPYSYLLNKTDIDKNMNRFYFCQLLEDSLQYEVSYIVYMRYGRIGEIGRT